MLGMQRNSSSKQMLKANLRMNNVYYQTNCDSQLKIRQSSEASKSSLASSSQDSSKAVFMDPYQNKRKSVKGGSKQIFKSYMIDNSVAKPNEGQQQVLNAKMQYENCALNKKMLIGDKHIRSLSSCSQPNYILNKTRLSSVRSSVQNKNDSVTKESNENNSSPAAYESRISHLFTPLLMTPNLLTPSTETPTEALRIGR